MNNNIPEESGTLFADYKPPVMGDMPSNGKDDKKDILRRFLSALIVIAILTALVTLGIYQYNSYNGNISPEAQQKIDSLSKVIGNQKDSIGTYKIAIDDLVSQNEELQQAKEANTEKINTIKNEYKKRASNAASLDAGSLDSFFSNRYH
jgi:hypothetical protein